MKRLLLILTALALLGSPLLAAEPVPVVLPVPPAPGPAIHLPELPPVPTPTPPNPAPAPVTKLSAGQLYVVTSDTPILVVGSRDGMVKIVSVPTPLTLYANFVDGGDDVRTYKSGSVYIVKAAAVGQVELIVSPDLSGKGLIRRVLDVDNGTGPPVPPKPPEPPEPPIPPKPPEPPPAPVPIPTPGFRVLILEETADRSKLPAAQLNVIFSKTVRDYLDTHCTLSPDGKAHEWAIWDKDTDTRAESQLWQDVMKRPHPTTPWIVISNPEKGKGFEGPLPKNVADTMDLLKKYAE